MATRSEHTDPSPAPASLCHLSDAARALCVERRRTLEERRAFESFRDRIASIAPAATGDPTTTRSGTVVATRPGSGLDSVREAYEGTVMSVSHYASEYDDTYAESVAIEFGPEIAAALAQGRTLDAWCKRTLVAKVDVSIGERECLLDRVTTERAAIDAADSELDAITSELPALEITSLSSADFGRLDAYRERLLVLEARCDDLATARQESIRARGDSLDLAPELCDLQQFLYQDLDVTYPVLSALATVSRDLLTLRTDVERAMGRGR